MGWLNLLRVRLVFVFELVFVWCVFVGVIEILVVFFIVFFEVG